MNRYSVLLCVGLLLAACQKSTDTRSESSVSEDDVLSSKNESTTAQSEASTLSNATPSVNVSTGKALSSRSLRELSEEQSEPSKLSCEKQFINKNGVCEIPNHSFPKELLNKSPKKKLEK